MLFKSLISKPVDKTAPAHPASAHLPVKLGMSDIEEVFAAPLDRRLMAMGLGRVIGTSVRRDAEGFVNAVELRLMLSSLHGRTLETIGALLEDLDAPLGSSIGFDETRTRHVFGRTEGLGLYLDQRGTEGADEAYLDVLEACTEALDGAGVYQGTATHGGQPVLYFYGDSYNSMKSALSFVLTTNPLCRGAYARRLA